MTLAEVEILKSRVAYLLQTYPVPDLLTFAMTQASKAPIVNDFIKIMKSYRQQLKSHRTKVTVKRKKIKKLFLTMNLSRAVGKFE